MTPIRFEAARTWLFGKALPFWARHGLDWPGFGFLERLDLTGRPDDPGFKRIRTQARQVYAFCHAHLLGWDGPALETAEAGHRFLLATELEGGGFPRTVTREGRPLDPALDLYDQAFVLYALAWRSRAVGDPAAAGLAHRTLDAVERRLARPDGRGFRSADPDPGEFRQNPHMHLLEAALAWVEFAGDARFERLAHALIDLALEVFHEPRPGVLIEHFDGAWKPEAGDRGRAVEPGHQYEWVWLLARAQRLLGRDLEAPARTLHDFARAYGHNPRTGLCWDCVDRHGGVVRPTSRSWAQAEALKAELALGEVWGRFDSRRIGRATDLLFDTHLGWSPPGTWMDGFDAEGRPIADHVPASILYHMVLAFAELLRLRPRIEREAG